MASDCLNVIAPTTGAVIHGVKKSIQEKYIICYPIGCHPSMFVRPYEFDDTPGYGKDRHLIVHLKKN